MKPPRATLPQETANFLRIAEEVAINSSGMAYNYRDPSLVIRVAQVMAMRQVAEAAEGILARLENIELSLRDIRTALLRLPSR
jgi:hypothetical protein